MASQNRPASPAKAPDPSTSYERAKPEAEAGMGRLDNNEATPTKDADRIDDTVKQKQPLRQINAHEVVDGRASRTPSDDRST